MFLIASPHPRPTRPVDCHHRACAARLGAVIELARFRVLLPSSSLRVPRRNYSILCAYKMGVTNSSLLLGAIFSLFLLLKVFAIFTVEIVSGGCHADLR